MESIHIVGIKVKQPVGEFYIAKIDGKKLFECSYAEVRNMKEKDIDKRIGIQRELSITRVKDIQKYVELSDACFPNSIILSVDGEKIHKVEELDGLKGIFDIELECDSETFKIIDGQHRIAGLEKATKTFEVNISLFLDMDIEQQAIMFSTINSNQKSVNPSLMVDLSVIQKKRNPIKSAHDISRVLNNQDGALKQKIVPFALGQTGENTKVTQANFVNKLSNYISGNKQQKDKDRDDLKNDIKLVYANENSVKKLIFRNLFIDERDADIATIILNYYNAVKKRWPIAWENDKYILSRTVGFNALFLYLKDVVGEVGKYNTVITEEEFLEELKKLKIEDDDWIIKSQDPKLSFSLNGSGQSKVLRKLRGLPEPEEAEEQDEGNRKK